jgi:hypothetical protein
MTKKASDILSLSFPPKIPDRHEERERAIVLSPNRSRGELKEKARHELISLLDSYPDPETAKLWKQSLRQVNKHPDLGRAIREKQESVPSDSAEIEETELNPETRLMLSWASKALEDYYLDDEGVYDPQLVHQTRRWLDSPEETPAPAFLARKFLAVNIALSQAEDPFEFDLTGVDSPVENQTLAVGKNWPAFVEPLLRQALSRVDWQVIGEYLIRRLSLDPNER